MRGGDAGRKAGAGTVVILGCLAAIGPFSVDMYLPAFPAIAADLHTSLARVGYSLASYFVGISLGQLLYGPLLDRFGRRPPLLAGLALYTAAAVGCALAPGVGWLIALRLLLALGGCVGMVAGRAVVRDLFPPEEAARIFSSIMLVAGAAPVLAPSVGGFVVIRWGWRPLFAILTAVGLALFAAVALLLPESRGADRAAPLRPGAVARRFAGVLKERAFRVYAAAGGLSGAGMFAYISGASFVFMKLFGLSEAQFALVFGLNAAGLVAGSQLNRLLLRRFALERVTRAAAAAQAAAALALAAGTLAGVPGRGGTQALLFAYLFLHGFLNPDTTALALAPFPRAAGSAAAVLGSLQMLAASLASALVGLLFDGTALPMAAVMAGCAAAGLALVTIRGPTRPARLQRNAAGTRSAP